MVSMSNLGGNIETTLNGNETKTSSSLVICNGSIYFQFAYVLLKILFAEIELSTVFYIRGLTIQDGNVTTIPLLEKLLNYKNSLAQPERAS